MKVTLEVFSLVNSEGSDALNDIRNTGRKRGSLGVGALSLFLAMLGSTSQREIHFEVRKLNAQFKRSCN